MSEETIESEIILQKLFNVQQALKVPKDQYNSFAKFPYKKAVDIIEKVKPILAEQKLTLEIEYNPIMVGDWHYIKATVVLSCIESGEWRLSIAHAREQLEKKGMDSGQLTGAISSYALKYALSCLFCLDDSKDDPDSRMDKEYKPNPQKKSKFEQTNKEIIDSLRAYVFQMNDEQKKQSVKEVSKAIKDENLTQLNELYKLYKGE